MTIKPTLRKATELSIGLTAIATLILAGCGGGGSGSASGGASTTTLSISPSLGRFQQGATVRVRDQSGAQIGSGYTDASGVASIAVPTSAQAPLLVEAGLNGDQYYDEKTGLMTPVSGVNGVAVRALVPDHTATSQVAVTALTEIAVGSLVNASGIVPAGVTAASAVGANAAVAQSFGVNDLLVPPKLVASKIDINGLGVTEADKYALKLAALAAMAGAGEDALKVAHRLRNDLNLTTPASGIAATIQAMNAAFANIPSAPANTTAAQATVPNTNAKLRDLIPAAINAANMQLALLDPALTKANLISALNTAALNNASSVMAAIAGGQMPASAVANALAAAQQQAASSALSITGFSPASGVAGATVTITGTGFDPFYMHNTVKFGNALATVTTGNATSLTVTVPTGATTGAISVTNIMSLLANKSATSAGSFTVNASTGTGTGGTTTTPAGTGGAVIPVSGLMGGAKQGAALNLTATVTSPSLVTATGAAATLAAPLQGITTDGTNLYVSGQYKVYKVVIATGVVTTLAGAGTMGSVDGTGIAATFSFPRGITTDGTNVYVAEVNSNKIRKIEIATGVVTTLAGSVTGGSADGTGTAASFSWPHAITTDGTNLYVADTFNHKIRKIVIATGVVTTLAGSGTRGSTDGTGAAASFTSPQGITTDGTNLYVGDTGNNAIRKIVIATGMVSTLAGSGVQNSAAFIGPCKLTTDGTNLYVSDEDRVNGTTKIHKIVIATGGVTTLAGSGIRGTIVDGIGTAASFGGYLGLTTDGVSLFVSDDNKIRKIQ